MAEHEPVDASAQDDELSEKDEPRAARREELAPGGLAKRTANARSHDAAIASEPMDLQRLPAADTRVPPGRQRTGDPPPRRPPSAEHG